MSKEHKCFTSDGMAIVCFCARGQDHNEAEFDVPLEEPKAMSARQEEDWLSELHELIVPTMLVAVALSQAEINSADTIATITAHYESEKAEAVRQGKIEEHNLVFTKSGELDGWDYAEWSLERLKELGVDDALD
jgi:hypothetical protein